MAMDIDRRTALGLAAGAGALAAGLGAPARAQAQGRVVVIGAGFGGASCARALRRIAPGVSVTLVEREPVFVTCPFSNGVIGGQAAIGEISFGYDGLRAAGVEVVVDAATGIDPAARTVTLASGGTLPWDRLVVSPGIDLDYGAIPGWDEAAAQAMPHAWKAGAQTVLLRDRIRAMPDGGTVLIAPPLDPFRCPPGPYERASLIAAYLKAEKPRSKILIVDAKDKFSKQGLFTEGWAALYGDMIHWVPFSENGGIVEVDPAAGTVTTAFETFSPDVANIIPPQRAGAIAFAAGLTGDGLWCEIDGRSFESRLVPGIHVLGDAAVAGDMPKSGFSAASQGKICAHAVAGLLAGGDPGEAMLLNTCYSLVAPDYGISVAGVYRTDAEGAIRALPESGGTTPTGASPEVHRAEAGFARGWYESLTGEMYG